MSNLRSDFEKLPEIKKKLKGCNWQYSEYLDCYLVEDISAGFINGAWFMFQKQQKELLEEQNKLNKLKETADWHIEDCVCNQPMSQYHLGWFEAMSLVKEILG